MRVSVRFIPRGDPPQRTVDMPEGATCAELLKKLGTHPDLVLTVRGDTPIPIDAPLRDGDEIKLVHVVSGGALGRSPRRSRRGPGPDGRASRRPNVTATVR